MKILALIILLAAVQPARADHVWRERGEIVAVDGATVVGIGVTSWMTSDTADRLALSMIVVGFVGAPVIHALNGHDAEAAESLLLRFGLTTAGALVGSGISKLVERCDRCLIQKGTAVGLAVGWLAASILDIAYITPRDPDPAAARILAVGGTF